MRIILTTEEIKECLLKEVMERAALPGEGDIDNCWFEVVAVGKEVTDVDSVEFVVNHE